MTSAHIRLVSIVLVLACGMLAPSMARAAEQLELRGDWYTIVDEYGYDESRRYERGWNRGAGIVAAGGVVRSPVAGVVRFRGWVAGRLVVTVATSIDDQRVVLTLTGLDASSAQTGMRVDVGEELGRGTNLHVGAYDAARRSRYLPVVARRVSTAATPGGSDGGSPSLSGAVTDRLRSAIEGRARLGDVQVGTGNPGSSPRAGSPDRSGIGSGSTDPADPLRMGIVTNPRVVSALQETHGAPLPARRRSSMPPTRRPVLARTPALRVPRLQRQVLAAALTSSRTSVVSHERLDGPRDQLALDTTSSVLVERDTARSVERRVTAHEVTPVSLAFPPADSEALLATSTTTNSIDDDRNGGFNDNGVGERDEDQIAAGAFDVPSRRSAVVRVPAVLAIALVGVLLLLRRRARSNQQHPRPIHRIAAPILPSTVVRRALVDDRDQRRVPSQRVSFVWSDVESGTSLTTESSTHALDERSPEHA